MDFTKIPVTSKTYRKLLANGINPGKLLVDEETFSERRNKTVLTGYKRPRRNPIWFSMVRDPVDKYVSRYYYSRDARGIMFDKLLKRGARYVQNVSLREWTRKNLNDCVLKNDEECWLVPGEKYDLAIVSGLNFPDSLDFNLLSSIFFRL